MANQKSNVGIDLASLSAADHLYATLSLRREEGNGNIAILQIAFHLAFRRFLKVGANGIFASFRDEWTWYDHETNALKPNVTVRDFMEHFFGDSIDAVYKHAICGQVQDAWLQEAMDTICPFPENVDDSEFAGLIDQFVLKANNFGKAHDAFPKSLAKLCFRLFDLPDNAMVFNPYAGSGQLIAYIPEGFQYEGESSNHYAEALLKLRALLRGLLNSTKRNPFFSPRKTLHKADLTLCFPPSENDLVAAPSKPTETPADVAQRFVWELMRSVHEKGKVVFGVSLEMLVGEAPGAVALQKALAETGDLQGIVLINKKLTRNGNGSLGLVILNKSRDRNSSIRILDANMVLMDDEGTPTEFVDVETTARRFLAEPLGDDVFDIVSQKLKEWNFKLSIHLARWERRVELERQTLETGERLVALADILNYIPWETGASIGTTKVSVPIVEKANPLFAIESHDLEGVIMVSKQDRSIKEALISEQCILINRLPKELRTAILNCIGHTIAVHSHSLCFRVDSQIVDIEYLALELHGAFVKEQMAHLKQRLAVMQSINLSELLLLRIRVPSIGQQQRRVKDYKMALIASKMVELKLTNMEQSEHQILAVMEHELRPLLSTVRTLSDQVRRYFDKKEASKEAISLQDTVGERDPMSLETIFGNIKDDVNGLGTLFDALHALMSVDKKKMKLEVVSLTGPSWLYSVQDPTANLPNCMIIPGGLSGPDISQEQINVSVDKALLKLVISNLIRNAQVHGFEKDVNITIVFFTSVFNKDDGSVWVAIDCFNDGKPLPTEITLEEFTKLGGRYGETKGTGIGGFLINRIIQKFDGEFRILHQEEIDFDIESMHSGWLGDGKLKNFRSFKVGFRIELPYCYEGIENLD